MMPMAAACVKDKKASEREWMMYACVNKQLKSPGKSEKTARLQKRTVPSKISKSEEQSANPWLREGYTVLAVEAH